MLSSFFIYSIIFHAIFFATIYLSLHVSCYNYWCLKSPIPKEVMILYRGASIKSSFAGLSQKLDIALMGKYVCLPTEFHSCFCISQFSNQKSVATITSKGIASLVKGAIFDMKKANPRKKKNLYKFHRILNSYPDLILLCMTSGVPVIKNNSSWFSYLIHFI